MELVKPLRNLLEQKFWQWIGRRSPSKARVELTLRNIYVLPTSKGLLFGLMLLVMFITGVNYQNSLVLLTTFFLATLFVVSILAAFSNLSGLILSLRDSDDCFNGEMASFNFVIIDPKEKRRQRLMLTLETSGDREIFDCVGHSTSVSLGLKCRARGQLSPGRLLIETAFPMGLVRAWSWVRLDGNIFVYPAPVKGSRCVGDTTDEEWPSGGLRGTGDISGVREYLAGDSLSRVSWKHFASKGALYVKDREDAGRSEVWLSLDEYASNSLEIRLQNLCFDLLELDVKGASYGVILGDKKSARGMGDIHRRELLRSLATYRLSLSGTNK
ncbi:MAG: DUF58 domain-containing protein [Hahellaceae bacterium]|nr:DUF58 domain-containing protein [Hahellaceae bacterium]